MGQNQEIAIAQMRKSVQMLGSSTEKFGDPTILRFLIARSMDPKKASKMFVEWEKWRAAFVPRDYIPQSEIMDELNQKKMYLQGIARNGCPLMVAIVKNNIPNKDHQQVKKLIVHILDKTIASSFRQGREIGNEKLMVIVDLKHLAYKNVDTRGFISGFQLLQNYYPERLAKCYLLHMPRIFVSAWRMISGFLDKATLEKIVVVSKEDEMRELKRTIGEEVLPEEYGGKAKLVLMQDFVSTSSPSEELVERK